MRGAADGPGQSTTAGAETEIGSDHPGHDSGSTGSVDIVFAHYNEYYPSTVTDEIKRRAWLYHKGSWDESSLTRFTQGYRTDRVKRLPNVGREGHTYLTHIVTHYDEDSLSEWTLFLQGDPMSVDTYPEFAYSIPQLFQLIDQAPKSPRLLCKNVRATPWTWAKRNKNMERYEQLVREMGLDRELDFKCFPHFHKACFGVHRDLIRARPKSFYQDLLNRLSQEVNPECGFYLEELWYCILSPRLQQSIH